MVTAGSATRIGQSNELVSCRRRVGGCCLGITGENVIPNLVTLNKIKNFQGWIHGYSSQLDSSLGFLILILSER